MNDQPQVTRTQELDSARPPSANAMNPQRKNLRSHLTSNPFRAGCAVVALGALGCTGIVEGSSTGPEPGVLPAAHATSAAGGSGGALGAVGGSVGALGSVGGSGGALGSVAGSVG